MVKEEGERGGREGGREGEEGGRGDHCTVPEQFLPFSGTP